MKNLNILIGKTRAAKMNITRVEDFVNNYPSDITIIDLNMRKRWLNKAFEEYNKAQDQLIIQNLDKHIDDRDAMEIRYRKVLAAIENLIASRNQNNADTKNTIINLVNKQNNAEKCKRQENVVILPEETKLEMVRMQENFAQIEAKLQIEVKSLKSDLGEKSTQVEELLMRNEQLEKDNDLLQNLDDDNKRKSNIDKNVIDELKNENNKLREEIKEINTHLESKCQEKLLLQGTITKLEEEIKGSHNANKDIMKLQQLLCETTADTRKQIKYLQKQMYSFKKRLYADQTVVKLNQKVFELNNRVAKLEEEKVLNTERNSKLVELEFLCHAQINSIALLESQKFELIQNLHMARQQISSLEDKLALEHNVDASSKVKLLNKKTDDLLAEGCFIFHKCSSNNMKLEKDRQAKREARKAAYRAWYNRKKEERKSRAEKQKKIKSELELRIKELFQRKIIQEVNYKSWLNRKKNNKIKVRMKHQINVLRYLIIRQKQGKVYGKELNKDTNINNCVKKLLRAGGYNQMQPIILPTNHQDTDQ